MIRKKNTLAVKAASGRKGGVVSVCQEEGEGEGPPAAKEGIHLARFLYFNLPFDTYLRMREELLQLETRRGMDRMLGFERALVSRVIHQRARSNGRH